MKLFLIINLLGFFTVGLEKFLLTKNMEKKYQYIKENKDHLLKTFEKMLLYIAYAGGFAGN